MADRKPDSKLLVALAILAAPWIVFAIVVRALVAGARFMRFARHGFGARITCPAGHTQAALGRFVCGCGSTFMGSVWSRCPNCRAPGGWLSCDRCGLTIVTPHR